MFQNLLEKSQENRPVARKMARQSARGLGINTHTKHTGGYTGKGTQMTALRLQTGEKHQTSPTSLLGKEGGSGGVVGGWRQTDRQTDRERETQRAKMFKSMKQTTSNLKQLLQQPIRRFQTLFPLKEANHYPWPNKAHDAASTSSTTIFSAIKKKKTCKKNNNQGKNFSSKVNSTVSQKQESHQYRMHNR